MNEDIVTYQSSDVAVFQKNDDPFGKLSNMAALPLVVNKIPIRTSEALYQACKFPHDPEIQRAIIEQKSPMGAKYKSRSHQADIRSDWPLAMNDVMRWCLRVKLAQHFDEFGEELKSTAAKPIVERSKIDEYWGAKPRGIGKLIGRNLLGKMLVELRHELLHRGPEELKQVMPPNIADFSLLGHLVGVVIEQDFLTWRDEQGGQDDSQLEFTW